MDMISLFSTFINNFNKNFNTNFTSLEEVLVKTTDDFSLDVVINLFETLDMQFKNSLERKEKYYVKQTHERTLLTSIGYVTFKYTRYQHKETKESYCFIRELLNLLPYQRLTNQAEYQLIKYATEFNMTQSAKFALRNTEVSRSTVSKKICKCKGSIEPKIVKSKDKIKILYIEMDEVHANLQIKGNKGKSINHICPCAIVHEGYINDKGKVKRKILKNVKNFASAKLSYEQLWELIYKYIEEKYGVDNIDYIFVSGDGAAGIKAYRNVFPNAIYVLDKFHFKKVIKYIFKDKNILKTAIEYIQNGNIEDFKALVRIEMEKRGDQKDIIEEKMNYLLNNIEGIKNQKHELYTCPCSMESHVSSAYARYITSIPYSFSLNGLENKIKLLVLRADHYTISYEDYMKFKYGKDEALVYLEELEKSMNVIRIKIKKYNNEYEPITSKLPTFENNEMNNLLTTITANRKVLKFI